MITNREFLERRKELEDKIADLCNAFIVETQADIEHISVSYGSCDKGYFPDDVINIEVEATLERLYECAGDMSYR